LYLFSLIPVSLRLQRSGLLSAVLSIVRTEWTTFLKDWTIFRKDWTVFRKARTIFRKARTVVGKAFRQIRVRMSPLPVALFYISRVLERLRPRRAPPAPPHL
jgi:hypothetical protein